jgi:hypothetical protein
VVVEAAAIKETISKEEETNKAVGYWPLALGECMVNSAFLVYGQALSYNRE